MVAGRQAALMWYTSAVRVFAADGSPWASQRRHLVLC